MGIFKRVFDSISGRPGEPARQTKPTERVSRRHSDKLCDSKKQPLRPSLSEKVLSASAQIVADITELPPPAIFPPMVDPALQNSNFLEEVVEVFEKSFEDACSSTTALNTETREATQDQPVEAAVQDLFVQIAANYAIPIKNLIFELRRGTASRNEIALCRPILQSIRNAAEVMNLPQTVCRINELDEVLCLGQNTPEQLLTAGSGFRQQILTSYENLAADLPEAFQLGEEGKKREDIIIKSLLKQIPGLGCVTLEKLYRAGLGSFDTLFLVNKEDLEAATGIPSRMCELICNKVAQHRGEIEKMPRDAVQPAWRHRLIDTANQLRNEIEVETSLENLQGSVTSVEQRHRHQRQLVLLEITVILAEMGELKVLSQIHKLSFKRRLQILDAYLAETEPISRQ